MNASRLNARSDVAVPCAWLARKDSRLARALAAIERPHIRRRPGGFAGLFRIIVEQQVSVASAQAIWGRCCDGLEPVTPRGVQRAGEAGLRGFGLTGQKARYIVGLAEAIAAGSLDLESLAALDDDAAARALIAVKGVGPWTAAIYLLFCDGRADIWPPGDVALLGAYRSASRRGPLLTMGQLDERARRWAPNRGLAAHILWTYYGHLKGKKPI